MRREFVDSDIKVTILTPTFNRAYTLPRLYSSLCRQSDQRFLWLIVDDGSTDNTKEIVDAFKANFEIQYVHKENGGKHTALNIGIGQIHTEYTFIVDSDDFLKDYAITLVNKWIEEISGMAGFAGVAGLRVNAQNKIIGQFPNNCEYIDCLNSERKKYKLSGDKAEVYKTELLKKHLFPVYAGEYFMPESIVWNQFSLEGLKVRWHKDCVEICEYLEDGLTSAAAKSDHFRKNFKGYRDDCILNMKVLKFPYNFSTASVFYARCRAIRRNKACLDIFDISYLGKLVITFMGQIRYRVGRY